MGVLSVTVHEVVHVACQTLTIVIHLSFMLLYDIFESWLCDLFKLICNDNVMILSLASLSSGTDSRTVNISVKAQELFNFLRVFVSLPNSAAVRFLKTSKIVHD